MVDQERPAAPDVLDVDDDAVVRRDPPVPVWVDLAAFTDHKHRGRPYHPSQSAGVFVQGVAAGVLWAWVRTQRAGRVGPTSWAVARHAPAVEATSSQS
jgi:hypothetical protein